VGANLARPVRRLTLLCGLFLACASTAGAGTLFLIDGRGWGHGIGMSQYGARGYAESGWPYQRILAHYYRGTELQIIPGRQVRVLLAEGRAKVQVSSTKPFRVVDARGKKRRLAPGTLTLAPGAPKGKLKRLKLPLRFEPGATPLRLGENAYRGSLVVHAEGRKLTVINRLPLDRYLRGVVPWEMPDHWHPEALKAQAVVARSYALATLKPGKLFDVYDDVRSQVYGGIRAEAVSTNLAVGATAGRVLTWNGEIATTFYHSTSGGRTAAIEDVWPRATPLPYLVSVPDPHDRRSKHHRWGPFRLTPAELAKKLKAKGVEDLLVERAPSGRVSRLALATTTGKRTIPAQDFRDVMGLRSTWFNVRVLRLDPHLRRAIAAKPLKLTGFVRGLTGVRLEQQVNGGAWSTVRPLGLRPDGRFTTTVTPKRTTSYRLAVAEAAGAAITVKLP
jgi:stage II sporulation protein D